VKKSFKKWFGGLGGSGEFLAWVLFFEKFQKFILLENF